MPTVQPSPADLGLSADVFPSFRQGQLEVATQLALSPARFPILNSPTGSGKSLMVMTAAHMFDLRTLIITPQKALQDQYAAEFDIADVRGQSNYKCNIFGNCELGAANECPMRRSTDDRCPNLRAIDHARQSQRVVTNDAFWMVQGKAKSSPSESGPPPGIGSFDLIVLDEGHGTPERLANFCTIKLTEKDIGSLLDVTFPQVASLTTSLSVWSDWARNLYPQVPSRLKDAGSPRERFKLVALGRDLVELAGIATDLTTKWIYQQQQQGGGAGREVSFTPVWATSYAEQLLFQGSPKVILGSATMLPTAGQYLGISSDESEYIDVANGFDPRNQPFIFTRSGITVTHKSTDSDIRILTAKYDEIIDLWRGYKGLLHTQSYNLQERIIRSSRNRHRFIVCERGGLSAAEAVAKLKGSNQDMIVVGPALKEGHDLKDDSARFQIIARMPLVNPTDPVTRARCESMASYSMDRTATDLMQMRGRIVRGRDDWGHTYTGDGMWGRIRKEAKFPDSFMASTVWENEKVPGPPSRRETRK